ncbi:acetohydroxy-acid synthase (large subunit) [Candidatus Hydrogenisulfobacillus filiaventi]|uniref:Acetolactate synthase n=1 Tax=Candidatus Hydrogenisulfobacillus filiaventi TaxID=2707344 RepID=A0A6F8ZF78_9FIRM|nr:biosynthetic-type acetolactate synthase large subunit [Bacillota bacterium]CAB1128320.1 acetohydroxy-acid synthase (large subunit) [Candidatus Hydrogenisulfobacillus filiaventi]
MKGSEWICATLEGLGVDTIFGIPGGAILPLVETLSQRPIHLILTRHESAAAHAADGYARATGRLGVALATSGPGGTNMVTGLVTAMADSVPVLAIIGQVPTTLLGSDAFQEADNFSITLPAVKHSWRVTRPADLPAVLKEAARTAMSGRPGPVVVEIPKDVQLLEASEEEVAAAEAAFAMRRALDERPRIPRVLFPWTRLRRLMREARRPLIYIGGGVVASDTAPLVRALAERWGAPVATTLMGIGAMPSDHPQFLGMLGMHGTWTANNAMQSADLVVALGARFDDRVTGRVSDFAPHATIVHVDVSPAEIGKIVMPHLGIVADLREALPRIVALAPHYNRADSPLADWWQTLRTWQREHPLRMPAPMNGQIPAARVMSILSQHLRDDDVVVTEVGQHQMWAALYLTRRQPRTFFSSGGAGTMGYGFPAGLGAQVGLPDRRVVVLAGDGSFQMNLQEIATLAQYRIPLWIVVLNNASHGMVRQWQDLFHGQHREGSLLDNPDFTKVADAFGIRGMAINDEAALAEVFSLPPEEMPGPVLIEVRVPLDENVFPMVPAGQSLSMVLEG